MKAKGLCNNHYTRLLNRGTTEEYKPKNGGSCSVTNCPNDASKRGWCSTHYARWKKSGDVNADRPIFAALQAEDRFWQRVVKSDDCRLWDGALNEGGYGIFFDPTIERTVRAHRYSFECTVGKIPDELHLDHCCKNKSCVRPAHLEPVTPGENTRRYFAGDLPTVARPLASSPPGGSGYRNAADTAENLIIGAPLGTQAAPALTAFGGNNCSGPIEVAAALLSHGGPAGRMDFGSETFIAGPIAVAPPLTSNPYGDHESREGLLVAHSLRGEGFDASEDGTGRGTPILPVCFDARQSDVCVYGDRAAPLDTHGFSQGVAFAIQERAVSEDPDAGPDGGDPCHPLAAGAHPPALAQAFDLRGREGGAQFEGPHDTANIRAASGGSSRSYVAQAWAVRRLTPTECERLQGFPDGWTQAPDENGKIQADGQRYRQLGNSMAVSVISWLGERILADAAARRESAA